MFSAFYSLLVIYIIVIICYSNNCIIYIELSASGVEYITYLPLIVKSWNKIGYSVIVIMTYHLIDKKIVYINSKLKKLKCKVILIKYNTSISLHYSSKLSRIYGFLFLYNTKVNTYFYISDSDIIPISKNYFEDYKYNKLVIKSFGKNGYGYGNNNGRWAMCYMVANKHTWYDILRDDIIDKKVENIVSKIINESLSKGERYFENFKFIDEVYLRDKIRKWNMFHSNVLFHIRDYNNTRIARNENIKKVIESNKNIIDIHLPKLKYNVHKIWKNQIIPLQKYLFNYVPYDMKFIKKIY